MVKLLGSFPWNWSAVGGGDPLSPVEVQMRAKRRLTMLVTTATISLALLLSAVMASADTLADRSQAADQAHAQVDQAGAQVSLAQQAVDVAGDQLATAQQQVVDAQAALTAAEQAWTAAQDLEAQRAAEQYDTGVAAQRANDQVDQGQAQIDALKSAINAYARSIVQDYLPLVNAAMFINGDSSASLSNRVQWSQTVLNTNAVDLEELDRLQVQLVADKRTADEAKQAADQAKAEADRGVEAAARAHQDAQAAKERLDAALAAEQLAADNANQVLAANQAALGQAQVQADAADQALAAERARIAAAAAAARQAAAAEAAREAEAARQAEEAARQAAESNSGGSTNQPVATPPAQSLPGGGQLSPSEAQSVAYGQAQAYGWGDDQFRCLVWLWNRESGWRWSAENPSSGAYGIPQSLPGSKMASAGADWRTNASTQIRWGLGYIAGRYRTPCGAWAHSEQTGWY